MQISYGHKPSFSLSLSFRSLNQMDVETEKLRDKHWTVDEKILCNRTMYTPKRKTSIDDKNIDAKIRAADA